MAAPVVLQASYITFTIATVAYECQVESAFPAKPSLGVPTKGHTACPGGEYDIPDPAAKNAGGTLTVTWLHDWGPTGISRKLRDAEGTDVAFDLVLDSDQTGHDRHYAGTCTVPPIPDEWTARELEKAVSVQFTVKAWTSWGTAIP